jgi:hypothetical protein
MNDTKTLAFALSKRVLAAAYFVGTKLEHIEVRRVINDADKPTATVRGFISWLVAHLPADGAVIEKTTQVGRSRRSSLYCSVLDAVQRENLPVTEVLREDLLFAFADPPLRTKEEVRRVTASFWPILTGDSNETEKLEAAALGIYVQMKRLVDYTITIHPDGWSPCVRGR